MKRFSWILFAALFGAAAATEPSSSVPRDPYSVEQLRAWHRSLGNWPWAFAPEQTAKLRSEGPSQLLLCSDGGTRSGQYVVFAQQDSKWVPISGQIDQAHHPVRVLEHAVSGWHDFQTFIPLWGSGGKEVMVVTYRWAGERYEQLSSSQGLWCEYEPFKHEAMCNGG